MYGNLKLLEIIDKINFYSINTYLSASNLSSILDLQSFFSLCTRSTTGCHTPKVYQNSITHETSTLAHEMNSLHALPYVRMILTMQGLWHWKCEIGKQVLQFFSNIPNPFLTLILLK
jgi:hypothetical protein